MKFEKTIHLRAFPVEITDMRTGETSLDTIVLDRDTLERARDAHIDHDVLIWRLYNRQGYRVRKIGSQVKQTVTVDLAGLYRVEEAAGMGGCLGVES